MRLNINLSENQMIQMMQEYDYLAKTMHTFGNIVHNLYSKSIKNGHFRVLSD